MGSQSAPPLAANVWLAKRDPIIRDTSKVYERYMDDILRDIKKNKVQEKLDEINRLHPNLKFTSEVESDERIAFLDIEIIHKENRLSSVWYSKPTDTGLIMNFHAMSPKKYKRSIVQGFVHRIFRASSSWEHFHQGLQRAKTVLEHNQYPPNFFDPIIKDTIEKIRNRTEEKQGMSEHVDQEVAQEVAQQETHGIASHMIRLQYRGKLTDNFIKKLKDSGAPVTPVCTLRKIRTFLPSLKPKVSEQLLNLVVYKIKCPSCDACYVGCTNRHICTRFGEHKSRRGGPVRQHFDVCPGSRLEWKDLTILHRTTRSFEYLLTLEALYIRDANPILNTKDEFRSRELTLKF